MFKKILPVIASCVFSLLFFGCQDIISFNINEIYDNLGNNNVEIIKDEIPFITVSFNNSMAKTINPIFDCSKLTGITLKGTVADGVEETLFAEKTYAEISDESFTVPLTKAGTYSFVMTAKLNERNYSCSLANIEIKNGENSLNFSMSFINQDEDFVDGNGNIEVKVKINQHSDINNAKVCLLKNDGTSIYDEEEVCKSEGGIFTYKKLNVPAGNYIVKYSFYNNENLLGYYMENVNVSKDLSSTALREVETVAEYHKINYELNGGSWVEGYEGAGVYSKYGISSLPAWDKAFKENDRIDGWFYDSGLTQKATLENIKTKTGDITLYAKYDLITSVDGLENLINRIKSSGISESRQIKILDENPDFSKIADALKDENVKVGIDLTRCSELKEISSYSLRDCCSLKEITIPDNVITLGSYLFSGCSSLEKAKLPKDLKTLNAFLFYYCSKLKDVTIPDGVTNIKGNAFAYCSSLESIVIPKSVTEIAASVFRDCSSLNDVKISEGVTTIGTWAFYNCKSLEEIEIPLSVTSIIDDSFEGCTNLKKVTAPCRFKGKNYFDEITATCTWIHSYTGENIECDCGEEKQGCEEGSCGTAANFSFGYKTGILNITGTGTVSENNFADFADKIETVIIDDQITDVYNNMFKAFTSLKTVTAPCVLKTIAGIDESKIKVTWHHKYVNHNVNCVCGGETQTVYTKQCPDSTAVCNYYDKENIAVFTGPGDGKVTPFEMPLPGQSDPAYFAIRNTPVIEIGDGVTTIGRDAFSDYLFLKEIILTDSVTTLEENAFRDSVFSKITLSKNIKRISNEAFNKCSEIETIVIPEGVTALGLGAFENCPSLKSITIPATVTDMASSVFHGCYSDLQITAPKSLQGKECFNNFNVIWY